MTHATIVHLVRSDAFAGVERAVLAQAVWAARARHDVLVIGGRESAMREPLEAVGARWRPASSPSAALREALRAPRHAALVSHMTEADLIGAAVRRARSMPHVSWRHFAAPRGSTGAVRRLAVWSARGLAGQVAVSDFVAAHVEGECVVVRTGVDDRDAADVRSSRTAIIAQRLEPEKDGATALRAWALARLGAPWRLMVVGDGSERTRLEALAAQLDISDSVEFVGHHPDVPGLLGATAFSIAPTPREGLGLSAIEAMAAGVPVVASGAGGHLETVGAVEPSLLFAAGDAEGAAQVIRELAADPDSRAAIGAALRAHQRHHLSAELQGAAATSAVLDAALRPARARA
ncbi:glycosyltransferase [Demequina sp. NBRC 110053]|uniref:glycosyltransferase n=1 Tax=Demequina sp. NBRC 110053 TaxID=1570342 RepID=UPI001186A2C8|nr:glycosyltransferase [Demequina sp. NBRC 110053]